MKRLSLFLILFFSFTFNAHAENELLAKIRPYVEKVIGSDLTNKLMGTSLDSWEIPEAPPIKRDATSTQKLPKESGKAEVPADKAEALNYGFIIELYHATRGTKPNEDTVARWMNALRQGGNRSGIYRALVLDNTYAGLEQYDAGIAQETADFAIDFSDRYFKQTISIDQLKKLNIYSLKRILSEKSLEIVDQFLLTEREDDLYRWYAVLSAEFARNYPNIWGSNIRSEKMAENHYNWAKAVPWDHLKSELVIKLNLVLNHING